MIPLRDNNPTRRFPILCVLLIIINICVFLLDKSQQVVRVMAVDTETGRHLVRMVSGGLSEQFAMVPAHVLGRTDAAGALPPFPAWITIFTSMFLHANWLHLGGNMLYLWIFGNNIEDVLGRPRFIVFYFVCGVGAAFLHIVSDPTSMVPTIGASGAIAGIMGAYFVLFPQAKITTIVPIFIIGMLMQVPAIIIIGWWFLAQALNVWLMGGGEMLQRGGGVAYMAHIGGFVTGIVLIMLFGGKKLLPGRRFEYNGPTFEDDWGAR